MADEQDSLTNTNVFGAPSDPNSSTIPEPESLIPDSEPYTLPDSNAAQNFFPAGTTLDDVVTAPDFTELFRNSTIGEDGQPRQPNYNAFFEAVTRDQPAFTDYMQRMLSTNDALTAKNGKQEKSLSNYKKGAVIGGVAAAAIAAALGIGGYALGKRNPNQPNVVKTDPSTVDPNKPDPDTVDPNTVNPNKPDTTNKYVHNVAAGEELWGIVSKYFTGSNDASAFAAKFAGNNKMTGVTEDTALKAGEHYKVTLTVGDKNVDVNYKARQGETVESAYNRVVATIASYLAQASGLTHDTMKVVDGKVMKGKDGIAGDELAKGAKIRYATPEVQKQVLAMGALYAN